VTTTPNLLGPILGVEPAELSEIAVDREAFRSLLELLSLRPSPVAGAGMKRMEKIALLEMFVKAFSNVSKN